MKKIILSAFVLGLLISVSSLSSNAIVNTDERGYITVNTQANKELSPDLVEISIAVETYDKSMQKAVAQNKELSDKVQNVLKSMINSQNMDYIKTSDFSATPLYTYSSNKRTFDKYQVSNTIVVHTKSINKAGEIIDKAIASGATNVNNLNFSISDYESQCDELLSLAVGKAKTQASAVAKAAGTSLAGIKYMNASCNSGAASRVYYNMMAKNAVVDAKSSMGASTPIEAGRIKVQASLNSAFYVK